MTDFKVEAVPFNRKSVLELALMDEMHSNWPVVYTINNDKEIYVGETVNVSKRMSDHVKNADKTHLKELRIFFNEKFNRSANHDLESRLIRLFSADTRFKVLNRNAGINDYEYFDRPAYAKSFNNLFDQMAKDGWFTRPVPELINSNLFKYSPFKSLNEDQADAVEAILHSLIDSKLGQKTTPIVIEGDPGTGKTIVAVYLMKLIQDISSYSDDGAFEEESRFSEFFNPRNRELFKGFHMGLVIPQQALRNTLEKVFSKTPGLTRKMIVKPFSVGDSKKRWDLLIVDETHRLGMRAQQTQPSLNTRFKNNNIFLFGEDDNKYTQLDWVLKQSDSQVLLLDVAQSIKPADLPKATLEEVIAIAKKNESYVRLASQMRVQGGEDYIEFIRKLFTDNPDENHGFGDYDLRFFDSVSDLSEAIRQKEKAVGLSRLLAGYAWKWVSKDNNSKPDIVIDGHEFFWNRKLVDWINSDTSAEEVGSIHTIQGYDLNYAGVIIGRDLQFDVTTNQIVFSRANYFDANGKINNKKLGIIYSDEDIKNWVINIYRVLLTRGIKGTYIYVCDENLREVLRDRLAIRVTHIPLAN